MSPINGQSNETCDSFEMQDPHGYRYFTQLQIHLETIAKMAASFWLVHRRMLK